jgi:hypothetical protein
MTLVSTADLTEAPGWLCLPTLDRNVHVIPTSVFHRIVAGTLPVTQIGDWEVIMRSILAEWLRRTRDPG